MEGPLDKATLRLQLLSKLYYFQMSNSQKGRIITVFMETMLRLIPSGNVCCYIYRELKIYFIFSFWLHFFDWIYFHFTMLQSRRIL